MHTTPSAVLVMVKTQLEPGFRKGVRFFFALAKCFTKRKHRARG